jgi:hypothetical protein
MIQRNIVSKIETELTGLTGPCVVNMKILNGWRNRAAFSQRFRGTRGLSNDQREQN